MKWFYLKRKYRSPDDKDHWELSDSAKDAKLKCKAKRLRIGVIPSLSLIVPNGT